MRSFRYTVRASTGLKLESAREILRECMKCKCKIELESKGMLISLKGDIIRLLMLDLQKGDEVEVTTNGVDEDAAIELLLGLFNQHL